METQRGMYPSAGLNSRSLHELKRKSDQTETRQASNSLQTKGENLEIIPK